MNRKKNTKYSPEKQVNQSCLDVERILRTLHIETAFNSQGKTKSWGLSPITGVIIYVVMVFLRMKTVNDLRKNIKLSFGKGKIYDIIAITGFNWHRFYYDLILQYSINEGIDIKGGKFIFDDTPIEKRGKKLKFVGKIFNHVTGRYAQGYHILSLLYVNGKHAVPLDFMISVNKHMREEAIKTQIGKRYDQRSQMNQRIVGAYAKDKIEQCYQMAKDAIARGFRPEQAQFDSWFTCKRLLTLFKKELGIHVIAGKRKDKTKYLHNGKEKTAKELIKEHRHRFRQYFNSDFRGAKVTVILPEYGKVTLIFTESIHGKHKSTRVFLATYVGRKYSVSGLLSEYSSRWQIETTFKFLKQTCGLGGYHGASETGLIAHVILCYLRMLVSTILKDKSNLVTLIIKVIQKIGRQITTFIKEAKDPYEIILKRLSQSRFSIVKAKNKLLAIIDSFFEWLKPDIGLDWTSLDQISET